MYRGFAVCLCLLLACASPTPSPSLSPSPSRTPPSQKISFNDLRVGWAYEAYPDTSSETMRADMARLRDAGATAIWIGQNNPGQVDARQVEPGLAYAVFAALLDEHDPRHGDAVLIAGTVKRALDAARATGMQVVLPIGYQIQMGAAWNENHPGALRVTADGKQLNLYASGPTASPYAGEYRTDITRYYEWVQRTWVEPYRDVIVMLSLADEPMGGDYSAAARQAFAQRYRSSMERLAPDEQWKLGEFQAGVVADYAAWSAAAWQRLNPGILTTMSFHGGDTARRVSGLPEIERLFRDTPDNLIITFDAYLHDDLPQKPATADEVAQLKLFLTTLGHYSKTYHKRLALWSGANAWGLAQQSSAPRGIPDAVTNLGLLYDLPVRAGGAVWGIFAWNYNLKQQGLYNYDRPTTYAPEALEIAVNRILPGLRERAFAAGPVMPEIAIVISPRALYKALAATRASVLPPDWFDTSPYARAFADRTAVLVGQEDSLQAASGARYILVPGNAADLSAGAIGWLQTQFAQGCILLVSASVGQALNAPARAWEDTAQLPTAGGSVYLIPPGTFPQALTPH